MSTDDIHRNVYNGFAEPITWAMTPAQFGYDPNAKSAYSFDLSAAKQYSTAASKISVLVLTSRTTRCSSSTMLQRPGRVIS